MSGKQIKLFLADGTPGGLTTAEITNWTGHVLSARRSDLADLLKREEAQRTGAYLLLGEDEAVIENTRCYIGEADVVAERLRYHQRDKDFWDRVVVITSKDANLTKAHGRYLESKLIALATSAGRVTVENSTAPGVPALPEADASDMDYFVSQLQIVLPVLGVNAIRVPTPLTPGRADDATGSPVFHLRQARLGVDASAQQIDGEFTMLADSTGAVLARCRQGRQHSEGLRRLPCPASTPGRHRCNRRRRRYRSIDPQRGLLLTVDRGRRIAGTFLQRPPGVDLGRWDAIR
jgi:hypothetical protein